MGKNYGGTQTGQDNSFYKKEHIESSFVSRDRSFTEGMQLTSDSAFWIQGNWRLVFCDSSENRRSLQRRSDYCQDTRCGFRGEIEWCVGITGTEGTIILSS